jgi:Fe-S cluster assembly ATP-binding protein
MSEKVILSVEHVNLVLGGKPILNDLSIDFWEGHVHAVMGPNGAGKSTLASTIMGLTGYREFEGDILFDGSSIKHLSVDERARMGITMAWQEPARFEGLPVDRFIQAGRRDGLAVEEALDIVGLDPALYLKRAVDRTLSGGERKRIELASILAMKPKLVLMDEPDSGIDVEALRRIFDAVHFLKSHGSTVLLITHSQEVLRAAEHAFLLCCGKLLEKGSVEKIDSFYSSSCIPCNHKNEPTKESVDAED